MVSSLCCWLYLVIVGFNDSRCLFRLFVGRVNQHFENLTQDCACQTSMFFLVSSALGKNKTCSVFRIFSFSLSSVDPPTVHLPGELRAQPWNRLRSVWNMGLLDENWAVEHLVMAIWCLHRFLTTFFQSSNLESKFETKPKPHISWPEMDIHRKHH